MHWTFVGDFQQPLTVLFRQLADQPINQTARAGGEGGAEAKQPCQHHVSGTEMDRNIEGLKRSARLRSQGALAQATATLQ
jgi:hypothetical protein